MINALKEYFKIHANKLSVLTVSFYSCVLSLQELHVEIKHALHPWGINMSLNTRKITLLSTTMGKTRACQGHQMYQGLELPKPTYYYR